MTLSVLHPIEPFTELFYSQCFYNSFFPVVRYFGEDVLAFLLNDRIRYRLTGGGERSISAEYEPVKEFAPLAAERGIHALTRERSADIVGDIKRALLQGRPVIVWIDCFFEPIRPEMYQKKHFKHTLLVYGFDETERVFHIIEHRHKDNLLYEKRTLRYEDMENAYHGFLEHFLQQDEPSCLEFYRTPQQGGDAADESGYVQSLVGLYTESDRGGDRFGLRDLSGFIDYYRRVVGHGNTVSSHLNGWLEGLNQVINCKKVEKYRMDKIPVEDAIRREMDAILFHWNHIRLVVAKSIYASSCSRPAFVALIEELKRIYDLETGMHQALRRSR